MATWNRLGSSWPKGRSRFAAAATAAGLAVCLGALALAPSAPATFPGKNGKIAFVHTERGGFPEVYTMRRDGSHERRLAPGDSPAFSPSGRKVLFHPRRSRSLHTIRANGTRLRRIPHTSRSIRGSFAPGGKKIVFDRFTRNSYNAHIYTIHTDGSHRKRIIQNAGWPQFSPNGRWIVFTNGDICLVRPNGTGRRCLTDNGVTAVTDYSPDFSPGGRTIVFARQTGRRKAGIYSIRLDGTGLRRLYETTNEVIRDPAFSPEGRKIVFSRRESFWRYTRFYTIWRDGSHLRRLSHGSGGHDEASWGVRR